MREDSKIVEIAGRKFKITKMDAFTGGYILFTLIEKVLPSMLAYKFGATEEKPAEFSGSTEDVMKAMPKIKLALSKEEFNNLLKDALSAVYEVLPARSAPIMNANGSWGVEGLEHNTQIVMILAVQSLAFNVIDFFGGEGLKGLMGLVPGISHTNTEI